MFNRQDILNAWYLFLKEHCQDPNCALYQRWYNLRLTYQPSPRLCREWLSDNAQQILEQIEDRYCY